MSGRGADHHVGINNYCKFCGSRWGGLIPQKHRISCTRNVRRDCRDCDGTGHGPVTHDPDTNQGVADDCTACNGTGIES